MPIPVSELDYLNVEDLRLHMLPTKVDQARGEMLLHMAIERVKDEVAPRTTVPVSAKSIVLECAGRAYSPRVQQESLGSRSVSYFPQPGENRRGVFLTEEEKADLSVAGLSVGTIWTRSPGGAVP